jgi:hypothetical protein
MIDAIDQVKQYDRTGKLIREISFPEKEMFPDLEARKQKKSCIFHLPITSLPEQRINLTQIQENQKCIRSQK